MLQPGQDQQVLDQAQQPLGVVSGIHQQLGLLGRQGADIFLKEQMHGQSACRTAASSARG